MLDGLYSQLKMLIVNPTAHNLKSPTRVFNPRGYLLRQLETFSRVQLRFVNHMIFYNLGYFYSIATWIENVDWNSTQVRY